MILYRLIYRLVLTLLTWCNPLSTKLKIGYELRKPDASGKPPWLQFPAKTRPVWFHCASGEFEYALPVIRAIKEKNPEQKILVTHFSPSYLPRMKKEKLVDYLCASPWDVPSVLAEFIQHHEPKALMIARTDVWQEMTGEAYRHRVPTLIFSMTFNKSVNALNHYKHYWQYRFIQHFFVVTNEDKKKLKRLIPEERITVAGDTRYDQCLYRLQQTPSAPTPWNPEQLPKKVIVAGSLWPEDEDVLIPLIEQTKDLLHWVLVPHEIDSEHMQSLMQKLKVLKTEIALSRGLEKWNGKGVLIVNEFGRLAHLYQSAQFAFVGGSFKKQVHSVMEPLATGCLTFVGPNHQNSREAIEFSKMQSPSGLSPVQLVSADNFLEKIQESVQKWNDGSSQHLKDVFQQRTHASQTLLRHLDFLN